MPKPTKITTDIAGYPVETEPAKILPLVANGRAYHNLATAVAHLSLATTAFGLAQNQQHEDEAERILTAACQLLKKVSA